MKLYVLPIRQSVYRQGGIVALLLDQCAHLPKFNMPQFMNLSDVGAQTQGMDSEQLAAPAF